jgi:hypothetical protein
MYNNGDAENVVRNPITKSLYNADDYAIPAGPPPPDTNKILLLSGADFLLLNGQNFDLL